MDRDRPEWAALVIFGTTFVIIVVIVIAMAVVHS
jgi:hypothetical protein